MPRFREVGYSFGLPDVIEGDLHPEVEGHTHRLERALGARSEPGEHVHLPELAGGGVEVAHAPGLLADQVAAVDRAGLVGGGGDGENGHYCSLALLMRAVTCPCVGK